MPRNPHKTPCRVPGCRAWAMRGHTRCRVHRDAELGRQSAGARGAGAPPGNLNAMRTAAHSHPLSPIEQDDFARRVVDEGADLPGQVARLLRSIQARVDDPFLVLLALRRVLPALIARVAARTLDAELRAYLAPLPPPARAPVRRIVERAFPADPERQLRFLRQRIRRRRAIRQADP